MLKDSHSGRGPGQPKLQHESHKSAPDAKWDFKGYAESLRQNASLDCG